MSRSAEVICDELSAPPPDPRVRQGRLVRELLGDHDWTIRQIAKATGISRGSVHRLAHYHPTDNTRGSDERRGGGTQHARRRGNLAG